MSSPTTILGLENRPLTWWLWASLLVNIVHLTEEVALFNYTSLHHVFFGFTDASKHLSFAYASAKNLMFHAVMVGIALKAGGKWRRYISQFFAVVLLFGGGLLHVGELVLGREYMTGMVTGALLVTPFCALWLTDLVRQRELTRLGLVGWLVVAPGIVVAIIYGYLI